MGDRTVKVWGENVEISVYQKSKAVWIATGSYLGKHYETKGQSENQAAKAWAEAARYGSN